MQTHDPGADKDAASCAHALNRMVSAMKARAGCGKRVFLLLRLSVLVSVAAAIHAQTMVPSCWLVQEDVTDKTALTSHALTGAVCALVFVAGASAATRVAWLRSLCLVPKCSSKATRSTMQSCRLYFQTPPSPQLCCGQVSESAAASHMLSPML